MVDVGNKFFKVLHRLDAQMSDSNPLNVAAFSTDVATSAPEVEPKKIVDSPKDGIEQCFNVPTSHNKENTLDFNSVVGKAQSFQINSVEKEFVIPMLLKQRRMVFDLSSEDFRSDSRFDSS